MRAGKERDVKKKKGSHIIKVEASVCAGIIDHTRDGSVSFNY